jgi:uncharacterized metal-binding protein
MYKYFSTDVNLKSQQQEMQNNAKSYNKVTRLTEISILSSILDSIQSE